MIRQHGEDRALVTWLITQEKVLRLWIEDVMARGPKESDLVADLEKHHDWLSSQIDRLCDKKAA
ncbi:hypothetical protein [Hyphococcus lacteus]|uniref:Uncharacterized protein n=1 Tax=Hyphococcus lacteus TaxID=3143536 RepID=A0ABV3Z067_9PROT